MLRNKKFINIKSYTFLAIFCLFLFPALILASTGTINSTNRYAWSENAGWIDFGTTQGNVQITDSELTGYAYSPKIGWISLNCKNDSSCSTVNYQVGNDEYGSLSGYAYSENAGWINFRPQGTSGVIIDTSGNFSGYAYSPKIGWISLNCSNDNSCSTVNYKVSTNYMPPVRPAGFGGFDPGYFDKTLNQLILKPVLPPVDDSAEIQRLQVIIENLKKQIQDLINKKANYNFTKNLKILDVDIQVKQLQHFLNVKGFVVSVNGPGSLNNETTKFGSATKNALKKFQKASGLKVTGIFDQTTRDYVNGILK